MSTRKSTRTRNTGPTEAAPTKTPPKQAESKKADPEPVQGKQNPFCGTCGSRVAPEENDPFLGSALLYDDSGYANLMGAMFLCGWQSQTLQKVVDGRPTVTVVGTPVDAGGQALRNRKIVTATWHHRTDIGWVQVAELCGYSRPDGTGFQNRTAEQLTEYVGRNSAEWVLAPIDEEAEAAPTPASKGKRSTGKSNAKAQGKPTTSEDPETPPDSQAGSEPTIDPESRGLPSGSTPPPEDPAPTPDQEPDDEQESVEPDPSDSDLNTEGAAAGVEEEVIDEGAAA